MIPTTHSYKRAKERLGWSKATLDRMVEKAFDEGLAYSDTKGRLRKYIDKRFKFGEVRIYAEHIFFFNGDVLITVYRLDNKLLKLCKH